MKEAAYELVAYGEVLLRLSEQEAEPICRGTRLIKEAVGSEMNIAAGMSMLGGRSALITALPGNDIGLFAESRLRAMGVSREYLAWDRERDARLGILYDESGAFPRKPRVVYDRTHSSFSKGSCAVKDEDYGKAACFHTSGITLALGEKVSGAAVRFIRGYREAGALISFDVNYRANLWSGEEARRCISGILPFVDIFFCSEDSARLTFGKTGELPDILRELAEEYDFKAVFSTKRVVHSPKSHTFGSLAYVRKEDRFYEEAPYERIDVTDRVGSGDAYVAGALFGLLYGKPDWERAVAYGNACAAVNLTLPGDLPALDRDRIEAVIRDHHTSGATAELDR